MTTPQLVVFDCDGTLVDSQHRIVVAVEAAFTAADLPLPTRADIRGIIGLSLQDALGELAPQMEPDTLEMMADAFRGAYQAEHGFDPASAEPLYPGVREAIASLEQAGYKLAIATGNSKRGLDRILASHALTGHFISLQTADHHPSKPHPSMVQLALSDAGVQPENCVVIGDTTFDIQMGRAAGTKCMGISWGYHDSNDLLAAGAHKIIDDMDNVLSDVAELLS